MPPGTSKWNKIEHRLFSFITKNWRGKPLLTHQVIVNLIANDSKAHSIPTVTRCATTTQTGLLVKSRIDEGIYPKGRRISDHELARVNIEPHSFHGEHRLFSFITKNWRGKPLLTHQVIVNYTIYPASPSD